MLGVVIQIDARETGTGVSVPLRAASHDHPTVCHLTDQVAWPVIAKLPKLGYDLFDGAFEGRIATPSASMSIGIEPWPTFAKLAIADTRFRLWTGEVGAPFAEWTQRVDARVTQQPAVADGRAELTFAVDDRWLDRALLGTYAGTTGAEGPAALKGQAKPLALGAPRYVPGVLVDPVNSLFQVSGHGAIVAIDAALERLLRYGPPVQDYASVAELLAAPIPAGRWATALSGGWARFGAPPTGQVCFMVRGDASGVDGWARLPGQQIRRLALLSGGGGRIADTSLNALDAARPYNLSLYLDQQTTARELIQEVAASVNAVAGVSWMGRLFVQPVEISVPWLKLAADGSALPPVAKVRQLEISPPFGKLAITAERTWSVHQLGDIAFTATLVDMGAWDAATTYREGNIVQQQGSTWVYINPAPSAGNAPPQLPTLNNAYWRVLAKAGEAGANGKDAEVLTVSAIGASARAPAGYQNGLRKADLSTFIDVDNGNDSGTFARSYTVCFRRARDYWKVRHFDVFGNGEVVYPADGYAGGDRQGVQGMINLLEAIPAGTVVVVYSYDEPNGSHTNEALVAAMLKCGASRQLFGSTMGYRGAYALVGVKGWPEGKGFEAKSQVTDSFVDAVVQIPFSIVGGLPSASLPGEPLPNVTLMGLTPSTVVGADFVQSAGPDYNSGWGAQAAYSKESYTGGAIAEWTLPPSHGDSIEAGLTQGLGYENGAGYGVVTFSILRNANGETVAVINGNGQSNGPVSTGETRCRIFFDGRYVRWYVNDSQIHIYDWMGTIYDPYKPENALRFRCALASNVPRIHGIKLTSAGKAGVNGTPGDKGKDGVTWYQYFAYANSPDGQVDFTTGEPGNDRAYIGHGSGTSPTEPTLPGLYSWSEYKGPPFGIATRGNAVVAGRQIIKNGGPYDWQSDAFSTVGFRNGCVASFKPGQPYASIMAGLNTDPTADASYTSLDYAWYIQDDGNSSIYENNQRVAVFGAYTVGTAYQIVYDGRYVIYYANGVEHRRVDHGSGALFFFDSSFATPNSRLYDVDFASAGATGAKGDKGTNGTDGFIVEAIAPFVIPVFPSGAAKPSWTGGSGTIRLRKGQDVITDGVGYSLEGAKGMAGLNLNGADFSFAGLTADSGSFTIVATYNGVAYRAVVAAKKVYDGSPAFKGLVTISGSGSGASASGQSPVPGGSTVRISSSVHYSAPSPRGSYISFRGRAFLYYRNVTDNGPDTALGSADGSLAYTRNISNVPGEPEYEYVDGAVDVAFTFTAAAADKIYEYRIVVVDAQGGSANVQSSGGLRLDVIA